MASHNSDLRSRLQGPKPALPRQVLQQHLGLEGAASLAVDTLFSRAFLLEALFASGSAAASNSEGQPSPEAASEQLRQHSEGVLVQSSPQLARFIVDVLPHISASAQQVRCSAARCRCRAQLAISGLSHVLCRASLSATALASMLVSCTPKAPANRSQWATVQPELRVPAASRRWQMQSAQAADG